MFEFLGALGSIILIDLVLSGDNALVIGAAAAGLQKKQRWYAIALGGGGAIVLRIAFAFGAALLLRLPLLQAIGGILLLLIAIQLLMDRSNSHCRRYSLADAFKGRIDSTFFTSQLLRQVFGRQSIPGLRRTCDIM